jgi:hypothetical protein
LTRKHGKVRPSSSGFVEHLLKNGRPLADPMAEDGPGTHSDIRGSDYYL